MEVILLALKTRTQWRETAEKYLGVPYVWGGTTASGGMDCSGYVYRVLNDMGFSLARLTSQGYYNKYKNVSCALSECEAGDLLFFGTSTSNITHIAFYSSTGQMLESGGGGSSNTSLANAGVGVRYRSIRSDLVACCKIDYGVEEVRKPMTFDVSLVKKGSTGVDVLLLQEILMARGFYKGSLDRDFGTQTETALKNYQKERIAAGADMGCGSTPDGECGEKTWSDLLAT